MSKKKKKKEFGSQIKITTPSLREHTKESKQKVFQKAKQKVNRFVRTKPL